MSLLDRGRDTVTVYQEIVEIDSDGNTITKPGTVGVTSRARVQLRAQSGTSARRAEQDNEGFETEDVYLLKLPRDFPFVIAAQASVEWNGDYWAVVGNARHYNGSSRTKRHEYVIRRT